MPTIQEELDALRARKQGQAATPAVESAPLSPLQVELNSLRKAKTPDRDLLGTANEVVWAPIDALIHGAVRPLKGLTQTITGYLPGNIGQQYSDFLNRKEAEFSESMAGQLPITQLIGEMGTYGLLFRRMPVPQTTGVLPTLARNVVAGAGGAALASPFQQREQPPTLQELWRDAAENANVGGAIGGGIGALSMLGPLRTMWQNWIHRKVVGKGLPETLDGSGLSRMRMPGGQEAGQSSRALRRLKDQGILDEDFRLRPAQQTLDPEAISVEQAAFARAEGARLRISSDRELLTRLQEGWGNLVQRGRAGLSAMDFGRRLHEAYSSTWNALRATRTARAGALFERAKAEHAGRPVIPLRDYIATIDEQINSIRPSAQASPGSVDARNLANLEAERRAAIEASRQSQNVGHGYSSEWTPPAQPPQPMVTVDWVQSRLATLGAEAYPSRRMDRIASNAREVAIAGDTRIASNLEHALLRDLEAAPAGSTLAQARNLWAEYSQSMRELRNSAAGKMFGTENYTRPIRAARQFLGLPADEITESAELLRGQFPEVWGYVRGEFIRDMLRKSTIPAGKGGMVNWSPRKMYDLMRDSDKFDILFPRGTADRRTIEDLTTITQRLMTLNPDRAFAGVAPELQELGRAGVGVGMGMFRSGPTQSPIFAAGLVAEYFFPAMWRKAIMEPQYLASLRSAVDTGNMQRVSALLGAVAADAKDYRREEERE